jgi:hypothetical protein
LSPASVGLSGSPLSELKDGDIDDRGCPPSVRAEGGLEVVTNVGMLRTAMALWLVLASMLMEIISGNGDEVCIREMRQNAGSVAKGKDGGSESQQPRPLSADTHSVGNIPTYRAILRSCQIYGVIVRVR